MAIQNAFADLATAAKQLPDNHNVIANSVLAKKVGEQKFFLVDSGILVTDAINGFAVMHFANPAKLTDGVTDNTKKIYITAITIEGTVNGWSHFHRQSTAGLPTAAKTPLNMINMTTAIPSVAICTAAAQAAAPSGGTDLKSIVRVQANNTKTLQFPPVILTPGNSIQVAFQSASSENSLAVYWFEE